MSPLLVSWYFFFPCPLSTYVLASRTATDITKFSLLCLKPWRRREAIFSSETGKVLEITGIYPYQQFWLTSWIGNVSGNLNRAGNTNPSPCWPYSWQHRNWCGDEGLWLKRLFFGLNNLIPTSLDDGWAQTHLPLLSEGVRVHEAQLFWWPGTIITFVQWFSTLENHILWFPQFLFSNSQYNVLKHLFKP